MKEDETFGEFYAQLSYIVNSMCGLGERYEKSRLLRKFLDLSLRGMTQRSPPLRKARTWSPWILMSS